MQKDYDFEFAVADVRNSGELQSLRRNRFANDACVPGNYDLAAGTVKVVLALPTFSKRS